MLETFDELLRLRQGNATLGAHVQVYGAQRAKQIADKGARNTLDGFRASR